MAEPVDAADLKSASTWSAGSIPAVRTTRPLVIAITGWSGPSYLRKLPSLLPDCDVSLVSPLAMNLPTPSVATFAEMLDAAVERQARPTLVMGVSAGGLVALAMERGDRLLVIDPPLTTAALWPLVPIVRRAVAGHPHLAAFADNVLGIRADAVENRDYRASLIANRRPGTLLIGGVPLEPEREVDGLPGLMAAEDREIAHLQDRLTVEVLDGVGHNITFYAAQAVMQALRREIDYLSSATIAATVARLG